MRQQLIFTNSPAQAVDSLCEAIRPSSIFVVTDDNVMNLVLPGLKAKSTALSEAETIVCRHGDDNKNLTSLSEIWTALELGGATRSSLVINVGGGMITDMGGFAASTYKRGIKFVNVPTTLLAAVDASVGGKTGINFNGYKNEIGAFAESEASVISTLLLRTLPMQEILSGYAEMIKHSLLEDRRSFAELISMDLRSEPINDDLLLDLLQKSVEVKRRIVETDMHEHGLRKALNLGHTVGHAFESLALRRNRPQPHGFAVAWGMVVELILSRMLLGFPSELLQAYARYVRDNYGAFDIDCDDYPELIELMGHDKKNTTPDMINFSLLRDCGDICLDMTVSTDNIRAALDIYRDLMGI